MAEDNYIFVSGQVAGMNSATRQFVDALQNVINQGNELKATLAQASLDGNAALAGYLGLATVNAPDNAARINTIVASVMADLNSTAIDGKNPFIPILLAQLG